MDRPTRLFVAPAILLLLLSGTVAAAQTTDRTTRPGRDLSQYQTLFPDAPAGATEVPRDFPALFAAKIPDATARAATSRAIRQKLMLDVRRLVRWEREDFEQTPELIEAQTAADQAWRQYLQAREQALGSLQDDPQYRSTHALREELKEKIADERFADRPDMDRIRALASLRLIQGQSLREKEDALLAGSAEVEQARQRYVSAAEELTKLRRQEARRIDRDPELGQLREQVGNANISHVAASAYLGALLDVANEALDYAYFLHRYDYKAYQTPTYYVDDLLFDCYRFGYGYEYR